MSEAKYGQEFIKHEFNEAIAVQQAIVEGSRQLADVHPDAPSKRAIASTLKKDERFLKDLRKLGQPYGASGELEEVAGSLKQLLEETVQSAGEAESEAYEAHAVLINLKRKQQDSAAAMVKIAREMKETELRDSAKEFHKAQKETAQELADALAEFAVTIATKNGNGRAKGSRA
ncbi:MAG TPA: hypothetical protein VMP67_04480 [Candidatus Limnocylindria bacterium]|nr:hypothetical protein [Candidatus Limnocylindria bacterium]